MIRKLALLLRILVALSLLELPSLAAPPFTSEILTNAAPQCDLSCCGPSCPCPTGKVCSVTPVPAGDRALSLTQLEVPQRSITWVSAFHTEYQSVCKSVRMSKADARPTPSSIGSPPQARLCVWLV